MSGRMNYELMPLLTDAGVLTGWVARCLHCPAADSGRLASVTDAGAWMLRHDREHPPPVTDTEAGRDA